jgi:hypothetical protein
MTKWDLPRKNTFFEKCMRVHLKNISIGLITARNYSTFKYNKMVAQYSCTE